MKPKITPEQAAEIRADTESSWQDIARRYGISKSHVYMLWRGRHWGKRKPYTRRAERTTKRDPGAMLCPNTGASYGGRQECGANMTALERRPGGYQWWVCSDGHITMADDMARRRSSYKQGQETAMNEEGPEWPK